MLYVLTSVETHLVDNIQRLVLYNIEITVLAVTRHSIAVFPIPLGVLHSYILSRNHLAVE